jgi:hypothetical protein
MKKVEFGKTYYSIIIHRSNIEVWIFKKLNECYLNHFTNKNNYIFDEQVVFIKSYGDRYLNMLERYDNMGFEEESLAHEELRDFVGFKEFMKTYYKKKRSLVVKGIIE